MLGKAWTQAARVSRHGPVPGAALGPGAVPSLPGFCEARRRSLSLPVAAEAAHVFWRSRYCRGHALAPLKL